MKKRTAIVIVVVLVLGIAAGVGVWLRRKAAGAAAQGEAVRIENPQQGELIESVNAPGEVEPRTKVAISAKVTARIVELPFAEGEFVTKGDPTADPPVAPSVVVRLDATDLEAALRSAEARGSAQAAQIEAEKSRVDSQRARREGIDASLLRAERHFHRCRELLKSQNVSQSDSDEAESRYDEVKAERAAAEHTLKAAETNLEVLQHNLEAAEAESARAREALSYTTITSPIDGVVTRVNAKVGELVVTGTMNNPGTVILEVADLSQMLLVVQVDEADIAQVKEGQRAVVRIHAYPDQEFEGVVDTIALTHDAARDGSKYFKSKILLQDAGRGIYSGLTTNVDIQTKTHSDILKVPSQAVLGRPPDDLPLSLRENNPCVDTKKTFATVVYRFIDGEAVVTPVTVGPSDDTHTVILAGIGPEDRIIVGPYKVLEGLKHEQKVRDEREVEKEKKAADEAEGEGTSKE